MKPRVLNLCSSWHISTVFRPEVWREFEDACTVLTPEADEDADSLLPSCDAAITGWGTKFVFTPARLAAAMRLRLILHTAGSVKHLVPECEARCDMRRRGVALHSGSAGINLNVGEATIGCLILGMRRWPELAARYRSERHAGIAMPGDEIPRNGQYLTGATIGLVALSSVARMTVPLLHAFGCRILAYDPFAARADADTLGVELTGLDDVFARSDAVSLHAPALPETRHMVGARQLSAMRDGALLVNTARGMVLDHIALATECGTGRIGAVLDVTDPEPLDAESALWRLPNVFIMPHVAGQGYSGLFQIGDRALDALREHIRGFSPTAGVVNLDQWDKIA